MYKQVSEYDNYRTLKIMLEVEQKLFLFKVVGNMLLMNILKMYVTNICFLATNLEKHETIFK